MGVHESSTPRPGGARASVVASFYGALTLLGFFWHAAAQDSNDVWRRQPDQSGLELLATPLYGVAFGLFVVSIFRFLQPRMRWLGELHLEFRAIFGRPTNGELLLLAAASAVGEEVLFRGAMLDAWGVWASSLVFALLHIPTRRALWPWTVSAFILGALLALLTEATGNLGAAVAAHFVINLQNMRYITRTPPPLFHRSPVRPAPRPPST